MPSPNSDEVNVRERHGTSKDELEPANAEKVYRVTPDALPLHCPMPDSYLWNSHPKVYLPIAETGEAKCPYCGAEYYLVAVDDEGPTPA
jgi:uncharacterized Zn-finger protein